MKSFRLAFFALVLAFTAPLTHASGAAGIYGIVEKVEFEPNASKPEKVRIYGAFVVFDRWETRTPRLAAPARGFLYFSLPTVTDLNDAARREWSDLVTVAKTGEAVAFSSFGLGRGFAAGAEVVEVARRLPTNATAETIKDITAKITADPYYNTLRIWPNGSKLAGATPYAPNSVVRLGQGNHDEIIATLKKLLASK